MPDPRGAELTVASPRPAATVIVLRDGPDGPETLMLQRSARTGFFPHAWVFPGGRVDPSDSETPTIGRVHGLSGDKAGFAVAAIRECFEEVGIWLGQGPADERLRADLHHRRLTLRDAPGLVADLGQLALWSWWLTPEIEPKRYDTLFFVAQVDRAETARHDPIEADQSAWVSPGRVVEQAAHDRFFLAPPTWWTLRELSAHASVRSVLDAAPGRRVERVMPRLEGRPDGGGQIVLPGDPTYPSSFRMEGPTRLRFVDGRWQGVG